MSSRRRNKKDKIHFGDRTLSSRNRKSIDKAKIKNKAPVDRSKRRVSAGALKNKTIKKKKYENRELLFNIVYSFLILIIVESIARQSVAKAFYFFADFPIEAIVNYVLIFLIFSAAMFFRRRVFFKSLITFTLLVLSSISAILMKLRGMPLFPYDILSFKEAIKISSVFLNIRFEIVVIVLIIVFSIFAIILFKKEGKRNRFIGKRNLIVFIVTLTVYTVAVPQLNNAKIISAMAWNPGASFEKNGFVYSFARESVLAVRRKPKGYNEKNIDEIRSKLDKEVKKDKREILKGNSRPNIIVVQLEAFMDPTRIKGVKFDKDPMPNMRRLMKNYTSGLMNVPVTGGGTARTEYEVLSGANFNYLNQGEIPYQTFLAEKPSISLANDLDRSGYRSIAIHNFYQRFYNRNKGLENLGFDKFIPLDVMTNVEYNPTYWPKDKILTKYIDEQLDDKDIPESGKENKPAFIFTISTQGHSKYPMTKLDIEYPIKLVDCKLPIKDQNQITYYANQVKEMDDFVGKLIEDVNKSKKPAVVVLYGDHLPALDIIRREQAGVDKFESLFVVANNFGKKKESIPKDFQAYELSTLALQTAGQPYGPLNMIHAYFKNNKDYQDYLKLVQYDLLFGKRYFLKANEVPKSKKMEVANKDLKLDKIEQRAGDFFILGEGFNRNTEVYIDGKKVESDYYNDKTIRLYDNFYTGKKEVFLRINDNNGNPIQETKKIKFDF
ncbi:Phosphoglycerol transferase MdoB [Peptostreptococcus russellii]|uniref:Phosphoglycerol transferase MdoB n=1 Tax=Peptostreptococcus russellii TaxID=215200 RepID=A0A1H8I723_9FIRM|nr:LTA synthase family protein [Peptostreptococcus russellii]SEN64473.1 Phosphoglycerol transferase MdoB [Peptostreptococcus russellii]